MSKKMQIVLDEETIERINREGGSKNFSKNLREVIDKGLVKNTLKEDPVVEKTIDKAVKEAFKSHFTIFVKLAYQILYYNFLILGLLFKLLLTQDIQMSSVYKIYTSFRSLAHKHAKGEIEIESIFNNLKFETEVKDE